MSGLSPGGDPPRHGGPAGPGGGRSGHSDSHWVLPPRMHPGPAPARGRLRAAASGLREPIVVVLLLIAFFTGISGKPLDGFLMLMAGAGLAWDAGQRGRERTGEPARSGAAPDRAVWTAADANPPPHTPEEDTLGVVMPPGRAVSRPRRALVTAAAVAGGAAYAVVVGSFARYSWPATVAVVALGATVVLVGWHGPLRRRTDPGKLPLTGTVAWGGVLVAGSLWELWALLHQPTLTTASYAHPTISVLTDPVLATAPGRSAVLALWLVIGWLVIER